MNGPMQIRLPRLVDRERAEIAFEFLERPVDVDPGVLRVVALPHRDRGAPVAVAGDGPVTRAADPFSELAVLDVLRHPVDRLVELAHAVAEFGDPHEPARHRLVDERIAASPAVRIAVLVARHPHEAALGAQHLHECLVGLEHLETGDFGDDGQEPAAVIDRDDHRDVGGGTDLLVIFAVRGCLMDDPGALAGGHVVRHEDLPRVAGAVGLVIGVVVPQAVVAHPVELPPEDRGGHRCLRILRARVPEVLRVGGDGVAREQEGGESLLHAPRGAGYGARSTRTARHDRVLDVRPDGERQVGRKRPGRRRPREGANGGETEGLRLRTVEREGDRDGLVLAHLVDVVVHAQLVVRQRGLVVPAIRQHPESLVGETLLVQLLECPDHRLHEAHVERLVVILEVDPARLPGDVLLPVTGVLQHRAASDVVECGYAHLVDLVLLGDSELTHRLEFGGESMGVPPEATVHLLATHRLESREEVFGVAGEQMPVVREPVGERWAVVEDPLFASVSLLDGGAEGVVALPEGEDAAFEGGQVRRRGDRAGCAVRAGTQGVGHVAPGRSPSARGRRPDRRTDFAVPPRLLRLRGTPCSLAMTGQPRSVLLSGTEDPPFFRRLPGDIRIDVGGVILPAGSLRLRVGSAQPRSHACRMPVPMRKVSSSPSAGVGGAD